MVESMHDPARNVETYRNHEKHTLSEMCKNNSFIAIDVTTIYVLLLNRSIDASGNLS